MDDNRSAGATPGPGLPGQTTTRTVLRALGLVLAPLGVVLVALGFYRFVTFDDSSWSGGPPDGFLMFAAGGGVAVLGFALLNAGFMGAAARYGAGETMPVVKDSAAYLTDGRGVLGIGRTTPGGEAEPRSGPYCRACGVRNDAEARFCDGCGHSLA